MEAYAGTFRNNESCPDTANNNMSGTNRAVTRELSYLAKTGLVDEQSKILTIPDIEVLSATLGETLDSRNSIQGE